MQPFISSCAPQGVGPAALRGGGPAHHGRPGVCSDDHLPQQGADGREPDAAGGQPPQRRHRPAAKVRLGEHELLLPPPHPPPPPPSYGDVAEHRPPPC